MAQIKIKWFEFLPSTNVFFDASIKLKVDFELIFPKSEVNFDKVFEILFSINCLTNSKRELKAIAGKKIIKFLTDENAVPKEHNYNIDELGRLHVSHYFLSSDIRTSFSRSKIKRKHLRIIYNS